MHRVGGVFRFAAILTKFTRSHTPAGCPVCIG